MKKKDFLKYPIKHIDVKSFDATAIIESMAEMSFTSRETANAARIFNRMIIDQTCTGVRLIPLMNKWYLQKLLLSCH